jgi:hypothetical protein
MKRKKVTNQTTKGDQTVGATHFPVTGVVHLWPFKVCNRSHSPGRHLRKATIRPVPSAASDFELTPAGIDNPRRTAAVCWICTSFHGRIMLISKKSPLRPWYDAHLIRRMAELFHWLAEPALCSVSSDTIRRVLFLSANRIVGRLNGD